MGDNLPSREYEIVGVAENVKRVDLSEEPIPTFYGPIAQAPKSAVPFAANNLSIVMRTKIDPAVLASTVRSELREIDAAAAVGASTFAGPIYSPVGKTWVMDASPASATTPSPRSMNV